MSTAGFSAIALLCEGNGGQQCKRLYTGRSSSRKVNARDCFQVGTEAWGFLEGHQNRNKNKKYGVVIRYLRRSGQDQEETAELRRRGGGSF